MQQQNVLLTLKNLCYATLIKQKKQQVTYVTVSHFSRNVYIHLVLIIPPTLVPDPRFHPTFHAKPLTINANNFVFFLEPLVDSRSSVQGGIR